MFTPTYHQLSEKLERQVSVTKPKTRLPGVRSLADDYKVSPNTMLKALRILEQKNLIEIIPKGGIFVSGIREEELRSIQVFYYSIHKDIKDDHLHREAQIELGRLLANDNYSMVVSNIRPGQTVADVIQQCGVTPAMRNGVVFIGYIPNDHDILTLREYNIPMVLLGCPKGSEPISSCGADGSLALEISINHLVSLGHRSIAILIDDTSPVLRRSAVKVMETHQLPLIPELIVHTIPWSFENGKNVINNLLSNNISFSAIVCYGDQAMLGAINAITSAGLRIPYDVALVICGSNTWCRQMAGFTLTGAWQDIPAIMGKVVQLLEMENDGHPQRHMHWVAPKFIIGDSCGCVQNINHKTNTGGLYEKA